MPRTQQWGFYLILLTLVSTVLSKSGVHLFSSLAFLLALWELAKNHKSLSISYAHWALVLTYFLAALISLLGPGGVEVALHSLMGNPLPLFLLPLAVFLRRADQIRKILFAMVGATVLAAAYSYFLFFYKEGGLYRPDLRLFSFYDVARWGILLMYALLIILVLLLEWAKSFKTKTLLVLLFTFLFFPFVWSNARGPWVVWFIGLSGYLLLFQRKKLKYFFAVAVLLIGGALSSQGFRDRIESIRDVKNESNSARIEMWKVGWDFFKEHPLLGVGFENTESPLRQFLANQSEEYRAKHLVSQFSFRDHHSIYLEILNNFGVFFFGIFFFPIFWIFLSRLLGLIQTHNTRMETGDLSALSRISIQRLSLVIIFATLLLGVFYTELLSYTGYGFMFFLHTLTLNGPLSHQAASFSAELK